MKKTIAPPFLYRSHLKTKHVFFWKKYIQLLLGESHTREIDGRRPHLSFSFGWGALPDGLMAEREKKKKGFGVVQWRYLGYSMHKERKNNFPLFLQEREYLYSEGFPPRVFNLERGCEAHCIPFLSIFRKSSQVLCVPSPSPPSSKFTQVMTSKGKRKGGWILPKNYLGFFFISWRGFDRKWM